MENKQNKKVNGKYKKNENKKITLVDLDKKENKVINLINLEENINDISKKRRKINIIY